MGTSSFDKINASLIKTADFHNYVVQVKEHLKNAAVGKWEFSDRGVNRPGVSLKLKVGEWEPHFYIGDVQWEVRLDHMLGNRELNMIVENNFGKKGCPTYFCKPDKVQQKWPSAARQEVYNRLVDDISRCNERIRAEALAALTSPECEAARVEFHERCIADSIKEVLLKYKDVAKPHVLKMALDEFVTHEIMES